MIRKRRLSSARSTQAFKELWVYHSNPNMYVQRWDRNNHLMPAQYTNPIYNYVPKNGDKHG